MYMLCPRQAVGKQNIQSEKVQTEGSARSMMH